MVYSLVADADLTRDGLIHRGTFIGSSASDKVYESKGTITMNSKGAKQCVTRKLAIQVVTLPGKMSPFSPEHSALWVVA